MRKDLNCFCKDDPDKIVTTLFDYYALPSGTPGKKDDVQGTIFHKVEHVERKTAEDLGAPNLIPNLLIHELEALLFSEPGVLFLLRPVSIFILNTTSGGMESISR